MTRKYGFLTDWQREYLKKTRKSYDSQSRAVHDLYIRKTIEQTFKDLALVVSTLENKQFDKIFKLEKGIEIFEEFLVQIFKRYSKPPNPKFPCGRIKELRPFMYMATDYKAPILMILQNVVQRAWNNKWLIGITTKEYDQLLSEITEGIWIKTSTSQLEKVKIEKS